MNHNIPNKEIVLIHEISKRAAQMAKGLNRPVPMDDLYLDVLNCHTSGCELKLADLLIADDFNFGHDVFGIYRHINRETGKLKDCFLPRYSK